MKKKNMKPLIVLLGVFLIAGLVFRLQGRHNSISLAARTAMAAMLVFTAIGHFLYTNGMAMMVPAFIPFKTTVVYLTGVIEIIAAAGLLLRSTYKTTGWFLIFYFILILPTNIYAALNHVDYQAASYDGPGPGYLWFRVPLQMLFIGWTYFSAIRECKPDSNKLVMGE